MKPRVSVPGMRRISILVTSFLVATLGTAAAQPTYRKPAPPPAAWDSRGWVQLGERTVDGRVDHDRMDVGRYEGKFSKLTLVVTDSDLELIDFKIVFADNTTYDPKVSQFFREGQRTRVLDLPPSENVIRNIDFKYRNLPGGGRAKVQVWGFKTGNVAPAPVLPIKVEWDARGWTLLGERTVDGRVDRDRIEVGRLEGKFTKLTLVALDSDLEVLDFEVKFNKGAPWHPDMKHYFREGQRTRAIDFPGDERAIKYIEFKYKNLPGGGRAKLQVWGFKTEGATAPRPVWDNRGWRLLGEQTVNGRIDRDHITVTRDEGTFTKLMIVVLDSDLELLDFDVKLGRGPSFHPDVRQVFRENTRTRSIDLPGDKRVIKSIDFKYKNLPGGGAAKLQVWGK